MQSPAKLPLNGDRWTPLVRTLTFIGYDFTGAIFAAQVRLTGDTPGVPLVDLGTVSTASAEGLRLIYGGTATVAEHIAADRLIQAPLGLAGDEEVAVSIVGMRINETTMEAMPGAAELGNDLAIEWDMHITPLAGLKERFLFGPFIVRAGVTQ